MYDPLVVLLNAVHPDVIEIFFSWTSTTDIPDLT